MCVHVGVLKDGHEPIAGRLIDSTTGFVDTVQKGRKVAFHQGIQQRGCQALAQTGVTTDVEEQDRDITLLLGEFRRLGVGSDEALDGFQHALGKVVFNPTQLVALAVDRALEP